MGKQDKRVDAYIAKSAGFAQPILVHLRELVHKACPEVEETIKWGFPHFDYFGIMAAMASFKQHCAFGFWKASLIEDTARKMVPNQEGSMGHFGRLTSLADLPADKILIHYIQQAARLNEEGIKVIRAPKPKGQKKLVVPAYFKKALGTNKRALKNFEAMSYSHKKDYIQWITEAKTETTRQKRIATALKWLAEGKSRNWKYERK